MYIYRPPYENELYHHGVMGMKWGVRRYQNADGTLTPAGRKRYLTDDGGLSSEGIKAEKKAHDRLYGKGSYDRTNAGMKETQRKELNSMWNNKSTEELKVTRDLSMQAAQQFLERAKVEMDSGRLFTDEYFKSKKAALTLMNMSEAANKVITERGRLLAEGKNDRFSLDYLEMTPDDWNDRSEKERLSDYKSWLDDPKKWRESH